jgi:hypothetical protein
MSSRPNSTAREFGFAPVRYYEPSDQGFERTNRERLERLRQPGRGGNP